MIIKVARRYDMVVFEVAWFKFIKINFGLIFSSWIVIYFFTRALKRTLRKPKTVFKNVCYLTVT